MKRCTMLWSVMVLLLAIGLISAQTVNVTFRVNTATVPDTIGPNSVVQVRGGTPPLQWDNTTEGQCVNIGGDLWEVTLAFPTNTAINYKFFANAMGDGTGNGWESDLDTGNRTLTTTTSDTVLPVKFFNKINGAGQDDLPYVATDSMDVWFRVNVNRLIQYNTFNPATQVLMVKGGTWPGMWGDLTWNTAHPIQILAPETPTENVGQFVYPAEYFWSGRVRIPNDSVDVAQNIEYKFVIADAADPTANVTWESTANRILTVLPDKADQTMYWNFWQNEPPDIATGQDTVTVKFVADLTRAISENGYTPGDTILAQYGDNGTAIPGNVRLLKEGFIGNIYSGTVDVNNVQAGGELQYNYYVVFNGTNVRENYFDFSDTTIGTSRSEKRKLNIASPAPTTTIEISDTVASNVDPHRQPQFRNSALLPKEVTVYWEVDLRPPYYQVLLEGVTLDDIQGDLDIGPAQLDSIFIWGVCINGLAVDGWTTWGSTLRNTSGKNMADDGTQGDVTAGDSIYTTTWFYSNDPDSSDVYGQIFKFGIYGGDNEAGGAGYGLNHLENIVLVNPGSPDPEEVTIFSQFGSINPNFYYRWNYDLGVVGIDDNGPVQIAKTPRLDNNYPNPFNPVTSIRFVLPKAMDVKLEIYNALGQKVTTLIDGKQRQGQHIVNWNGIDSKGYPVSSGIYFYRLNAENYQKTMKMVLMK
jgi:hypothetical protein